MSEFKELREENQHFPIDIAEVPERPISIPERPKVQDYSLDKSSERALC